MGRSTVHYADNDTNNILKRLHNKLRPAGTPVERVEYIIELLLLRIFETKLKQDEIFKPLRILFEGENYRLLFSYIHSLSNGDRILSELNKNIFPFYATILLEARKVITGNLPSKMQDQLVLMEEVFANSNFTNNVKGGVITEVIGLVNDIDEKYILKTDLLGDAIESALSETGGTKDLGLYRTPDHIRRMMVTMVDPTFTDTIFDPACGTAGFLFDAFEYVIDKSNETGDYPSAEVGTMFYRTGIGGVEYQGRIRKMAAVNLYIRGLNPHNIMQGDSLKMYDPARDAGSKTVVIANPPFGAERDQPAYPNVWEEYSKESETTILFVKLMFDYLKKGGRCAVVVSEGFLTWGQGSACALRKMLLNETNLRAIISLPQGVFVSKSGQGAKTSILYFEKGQPTEFVWYYKIENDGFSMGTNRKPIEGSQIPDLLKNLQLVKQGKKPDETPHCFCISREQIETLDPQIAERITFETSEKAIARNSVKREKKIAELDKKMTDTDIAHSPKMGLPEWYTEELAQFDSNMEAQIENEIAKAIEKAHTCHFNLQNYRSDEKAEQSAYPLVELKELITVNDNRIKPANFPETEFAILGVSKQTGIFMNEKVKGENIKQSYFTVKKNDFCYNPYRINVGSIGLCELEFENQIISGAYNIFSCNESKLNPKFLDALFKTKNFLRYVNENATGGVRMDFKINFMQNWKIPLPPLEIQNGIVEKIEKQKQIIEGAEKIEKEITFNITIDRKWEKCSLNDLCDKIIVGGTPKEKNFHEGTVPFLKVNNLGFNLKLNFNNEYLITGTTHKNELKRSQCYPDDVLMNIVGPPMGKVAIVPKEITTCNINQAIVCFRVSGILLNRFLAYYLLMHETQNLLLEDVRKSTGQWNLTKSICSKLKIYVPPLSIQHQIVEKLDRQMEALESVRFLKAEAEKRIEEIITDVWRVGATLAVTQPLAITQISQMQKENAIEKRAFLKRKVLASFIINQSLNDPNFGNVKFQKLFFLSEYFIIKRPFGQKYYVQAAGPYDNNFTNHFYEQIENQDKWFIKRKDGNQFRFMAGEKHDKSKITYNLFSKNELDRVKSLIDCFNKTDYEKPEIIATLYAVWNNRIIQKEPITDELLIEDFLNWDKQKIKYKDRLVDALKWMKKEGFVPDGWGRLIV